MWLGDYALRPTFADEKRKNDLHKKYGIGLKQEDLFGCSPEI